MDASVSVALKSGLPLSFSGSFGLKVNTTGSAVKGTVGTVVIDLPAGNYFRAEATGAQLAALGQSLSGDFILESSTFIENALPVTVVTAGFTNVEMTLGSNQAGVHIQNGKGGFQVRPTGVAAQFEGDVELVGTGDAFSLSGKATGRINNTGKAVVTSYTLSNGNVVSIDFSDTGTDSIVEAGGGVTVNVVAVADIYKDNPGLVLYSDASLSVGNFFGAGGSSNPIFQFYVGFHLEFNTRSKTNGVTSDQILVGSTTHTVPRESLKVGIDGRVDLFGGLISLDGHGAIKVQDGIFQIGVGMHATLTPVLELNAQGFFSSDGQFSIDVSGRANLGVDGFGIFGNVGVTISYLNQPNVYGTLVKTLYVHGHADVALKAFDITIVGLGLDVEYSSGTGEFGLTVDIDIIGIHIQPHFTLGYVKPPPAPQFARVENGALVLNVGDDANRRNIGKGQADESYVISQTGNRINIFAFGLTESYNISDQFGNSRFNRIVGGDFKSGIDTLEIQSTVTLPITNLTMGDQVIVRNFGMGALVLLAGDNATITTLAIPGTDITAGRNARITATGGTPGGTHPILRGASGSRIDAKNAARGVDITLTGGDSEAYGTPFAESLTIGNGSMGSVSIFGMGGGDSVTDLGSSGPTLIDTHSVNAADTAPRSLIATFAKGTVKLIGGEGPDTIKGGAGTNNVSAGGGDDTIYSGVGRLTVSGGNGDDSIYSHYGDVWLDGGAGNNTLYLDYSNDGSFTAGLYPGRIQYGNESATYLNLILAPITFGSNINSRITYSVNNLAVTPAITGGDGGYSVIYNNVTTPSLALGNGRNSVTYNSVTGQPNLTLGNGGNTLNINSLLGTVPVTISLGVHASGQPVKKGDFVTIVDSAVPLSLLVDNALRPADGEVSVIVVDRRGTSVPSVGTLTASGTQATVTGLTTQPITFNGFQKVDLELGQGADQFNVTSTPLGAETTVNGNRDADTFTITGANSKIRFNDGFTQGPVIEDTLIVPIPTPANRVAVAIPAPGSGYQLGNLFEYVGYSVGKVVIDDTNGPDSDSWVSVDRVVRLTYGVSVKVVASGDGYDVQVSYPGMTAEQVISIRVFRNLGNDIPGNATKVAVYHFEGQDPIGTYTAIVDLGGGISLPINSTGVIQPPDGATGRIVKIGDAFKVQTEYYNSDVGSTNRIYIIGFDSTSVIGNTTNVENFHFSGTANTPSAYTATINLSGGNTLVLNGAGKVSGPTNASGEIVANHAGGFDVRISSTEATGGLQLPVSITGPNLASSTGFATNQRLFHFTGNPNTTASDYYVDINFANSGASFNSDGSVRPNTRYGTLPTGASVRINASSTGGFDVLVIDPTTAASNQQSYVSVHGINFEYAISGNTVNTAVLHFDVTPNALSDFTAIVDLGNGDLLPVNSQGVINVSGAQGQIVANAGGGNDVRFLYPSGQQLSVQVAGSDGTQFSGTIANYNQFHFDPISPALAVTRYIATVDLGTGTSLVLDSTGPLSGPTGTSGQIVFNQADGFDVKFNYPSARGGQVFPISLTGPSQSGATRSIVNRSLYHYDGYQSNPSQASDYFAYVFFSNDGSFAVNADGSVRPNSAYNVPAGASARIVPDLNGGFKVQIAAPDATLGQQLGIQVVGLDGTLSNGSVTNARVFHFASNQTTRYTAVILSDNGTSVALNAAGVITAPAGVTGQIVLDQSGGFSVQVNVPDDPTRTRFGIQVFGPAVLANGSTTHTGVLHFAPSNPNAPPGVMATSSL